MLVVKTIVVCNLEGQPHREFESHRSDFCCRKQSGFVSQFIKVFICHHHHKNNLNLPVLQAMDGFWLSIYNRERWFTKIESGFSVNFNN